MALTRNGILFRDSKDGNGGGWSVKGGRTYSCQVDAYASVNVGPHTILKTTGFRYGDYYRWPLTRSPVEIDTGSFIQSISIRQAGRVRYLGAAGLKWQLGFEFSPFDINHEAGGNDEVGFDGKLNPFQAPPTVSWNGRAIEKVYPYDFSTTPKPYVNAAGDPLEDPPKSEDSNPVLQITRFEQTYDPTIVSSYRNRINDSAWLAHGSFAGFPAYTVKCTEISAKRVYDPDWGVYWEVTYEFEFKLEPDETGTQIGWKAKVLNAGMRCLSSGKLVPCLVQGHPVSSPVNLTNTGTFDATSPPTPNYLTFQPFKTANFAGLSIPVTIFDSGLLA